MKVVIVQQTIELPAHIESINLLAGNLALDFCNTVGQRNTDTPSEFLREYGDIVYWGLHTHVLTEAAAYDLFQRAAMYPDDAQAVYQQALRLREAVYQLALSVIQQIPCSPNTLAQFNQHLQQALLHRELIQQGDQWVWGWQTALDSVLWSVAQAAADLLTTLTPDRLRQCSGCGWLFYDTSHNGRRVWCDMRYCGNRAKAQKHYHRRKEPNQ